LNHDRCDGHDEERKRKILITAGTAKSERRKKIPVILVKIAVIPVSAVISAFAGMTGISLLFVVFVAPVAVDCFFKVFL
jgi:hypothetical protein